MIELYLAPLEVYVGRYADCQSDWEYVLRTPWEWLTTL